MSNAHPRTTPTTSLPASPGLATCIECQNGREPSGMHALSCPNFIEYRRWVIRDIGVGWFSINDRGVDGRGHHQQFARAFSRGRAEVVRDAFEAAWPLQDES